VTARGTDWSLALLVALLVATGLLTAFAGSPGSAWVFALHGALGFGIAVVLVWKSRRVWRRVADPARWDGRTGFGLVAAALVLGALASGFCGRAGPMCGSPASGSSTGTGPWARRSDCSC